MTGDAEKCDNGGFAPECNGAELLFCGGGQGLTKRD